VLILWVSCTCRHLLVSAAIATAVFWNPSIGMTLLQNLEAWHPSPSGECDAVMTKVLANTNISLSRARFTCK
jgi:hypothetical protein